MLNPEASLRMCPEYESYLFETPRMPDGFRILTGFPTP